MLIRNPIRALVFAMLFAIASSPATSSEQMLPAHFTAFAVTTGGPRTAGGAGQVDIRVTRWSTAEEVEAFFEALRSDGHSGLIREFQDVDSVGRIQVPGTLGYDLRYAQQEDLGDGMQRIVLVTDRPLSFYETVNRPPSAEYPFTMIELLVDSEGRGHGSLAVASALAASRNGQMLQVYNYDTQPIQLNEVRRVDR